MVFETKKVVQEMTLKAQNHVVRKYDPGYTRFGSITAASDAELKAQCVEYGEFLPKPNFLFLFFMSVYNFSVIYLGMWASEVRNGPTKGSAALL